MAEPQNGEDAAEKHGSGAYLMEDHALPLGFLLRGLTQVDRDSALKGGLAYVLYLLLFIVIQALAHPTSSIFEVQRGVSMALADAPVGSQFQGNFHAVGTFEEFWTWAQGVLYAQAFNSYLQNDQNNTAGQRYVIGKYNHLISPIRFRQVRSSEGAGLCEARPEAAAGITSPCWSFWTPGTDDASLRGANVSGASYHAGGLSLLSGEYGVYGSGGHVVDLDLEPTVALERMRSMMRERWTDEWSRVVAVDVNVYTPAYDLATAFRFQVDRALGGRLHARVETLSCPLTAYPMNAAGVASMGLSCIWLVGFLVHLGWFVKGAVRRRGLDLWAFGELFCLACFAAAIWLRVDFLLLDRAPFQARSATQFQDLYSVCSLHGHSMMFASFAVLWTTLQAVRYARHHPRVAQLWQVLQHAGAGMLPFVVVALMATMAFCLAAFWLYGTEVRGFHTLASSMGFLFSSMLSGFRSKQQGQVANVLAQMATARPGVTPVWATAWILLSELIIFNLFVAILVNSFLLVVQRGKRVAELEDRFTMLMWEDNFYNSVSCCLRDMDTLDHVKRYRNGLRVWQKHVRQVSLEKLTAIVNTQAARGERDFTVTDAMQLFPSKDPADSYWNALQWMRSLSEEAGVKLRRPKGEVSMQREIQQLMAKLGRLEEESLGLGLQLQASVPDVPSGHFI